MTELQWRLNVYAPTGAFVRTIYRDQSAVLSDGFRMSLTPNGDCREMSFRARGSPGSDRPNWGLTPLQAVQFEILNGGAYVPLFYAQIRMGGNQQDTNGESYTLRSLALRLKAVTLPDGFKTPQQPAHLTVRTAIQAVIASEQLGSPSLIVYDESLIPDLGFDCREVANGNRQNPYALLEQIVQDGAGLGVSVVFGVRPDRKFYCQVAKTDTLTLSDSETRRTIWKAPVAETPITSVLWFLGKRSDGSPLNYQSYRMPNDPYGEWTHPQPIDASLIPYITAAFTATANDGTSAGEVTLNSSQLAPLTDVSDNGNTLTVYAESDSGNVTITQTLTAGATRHTIEVTWINGDIALNKVVVNQGGTLTTYTATQLRAQGYGGVGYVLFRSDAYAPVPLVLYDLAPGTVITYSGYSLPTADADQRRVSVVLNTSHPEIPNALELDRAAQNYYVIPASDPADIELQAFRTPSELAGRVEVGSYNRAVDAWEYRLSSKDGLILAAQTGQADDPNRKAQADLIKYRDSQSVITSITART